MDHIRGDINLLLPHPSKEGSVEQVAASVTERTTARFTPAAVQLRAASDHECDRHTGLLARGPERVSA